MWFRTRRRLSFYAHTAIWRLHATAICALRTVSQRKGKASRLTILGAFVHAEVRWQGSRTYTSTFISCEHVQMQHAAFASQQQDLHSGATSHRGSVTASYTSQAILSTEHQPSDQQKQDFHLIPIELSMRSIADKKSLPLFPIIQGLATSTMPSSSNSAPRNVVVRLGLR